MMKRETKDPTGDLYAPSRSKQCTPSVLCCVGYVFAGKLDEGMSEGDLVIAKKFIGFPLNVRRRRVEYVVDCTKAMVREEALEVHLGWKSPGIALAGIFKDTQRWISGCEAG